MKIVDYRLDLIKTLKRWAYFLEHGSYLEQENVVNEMGLLEVRYKPTTQGIQATQVTPSRMSKKSKRSNNVNI